MIKWLKSGIKPSWEDIATTNEASKFYWARYDSLFLVNEVLYHKWESVVPKIQIVLPKSLISKVLQGTHDELTGGHLGFKKSLSKVRDKYFWYNMISDVKHHCSVCDVCASKKSRNKLPKAPLQTYNVGMDFGYSRSIAHDAQKEPILIGNGWVTILPSG